MHTGAAENLEPARSHRLAAPAVSVWQWKLEGPGQLSLLSHTLWCRFWVSAALHSAQRSFSVHMQKLWGGVWTHDCCLWPPRGHFWTSALALTHPKNVEIVECEVHCWNTLVFEAGSSSVDRLAWNSQKHNYLYLTSIRFKGVCHHVWLLTGF